MTDPAFYHSRYHLRNNFRSVHNGGRKGPDGFQVRAQWRSYSECRNPSRSGKKKCGIQTVISPRRSTKKKPRRFGEQLPSGGRCIGVLDSTVRITGRREVHHKGIRERVEGWNQTKFGYGYGFSRAASTTCQSLVLRMLSHSACWSGATVCQ